MTAGELLIEQGRQQGYREGIEQARQQFRPLFQNFLPRSLQHHLVAASFDQLERWSLRAWSAASLADVFRADDIESEEPRVTAELQLIERGRQQGRELATQDLLLRLLRQRFGTEVDAHAEQRIAAALIEQLESWAEGIQSAATLA